MCFSLLGRSLRGLCAVLAMTLAAHAHAGIVLNTTRVIYQGADREASLQVHNTGTGEILAQSWLEDQSQIQSAISPLFAITPSLARMAGNAKQLIRIIYSGEGLASDRESVLWLNVQEIPQTARDNELQIAIRQRIKLFYRPQGLTDNPLQAAQALQWQLRDGQLEVTNPGPYHVSTIKLEVTHDGQVLLKEDSRMLAPKTRLRLPLQPVNSRGPLDLAFISINDFGAQEPYRAKVSGERVTQASKVESAPE
ncbi:MULTISPECIES: fimbrial biogenesis chaperone [unclassified Pseudomonas]|uniref:fimbrial biogenesis chaperone n=1 Tax=unclassified Pseudomonas TaxID=196821 RepID=UPI0025D19BC4|nr:MULTISPECIES: molecular chaperone [unclassified Pseudomonas]